MPQERSGARYPKADKSECAQLSKDAIACQWRHDRSSSECERLFEEYRECKRSATAAKRQANTDSHTSIFGR
jgi:hypothetical protein